MTILVLGATGMLGHRLCWGLHALGHEVLAGVRSETAAREARAALRGALHGVRFVAGFDAYDLPDLRERVALLKPRVVINCIGVVKQRDDGQSSVPCIALNALLPHVLEELVTDWNGWLIHFSTDCVFKGDRGNYTEADASDASDWYGRTKAMGEVSGPRALTLRTSIIGRELRSHRSLVDWLLAQQGKVVSGYTRAIFSGLTTREYVRVVDMLLRGHWGMHGLYQVAARPISKYDLLELIRRHADLDVEVRPDAEALRIDRSLNPARFQSATGYTAPEWEQMIAEMVQDFPQYQAG